MADAQTHTIGRRKEAVCRVYLKAGSGKWTVNGRTLGDYFPRPAHVSSIQQPFTATDTLGRQKLRLRLRVYPGADHPHVAQQPTVLNLKTSESE